MPWVRVKIAERKRSALQIPRINSVGDPRPPPETLARLKGVLYVITYDKFCVTNQPTPIAPTQLLTHLHDTKQILCD